jgi:hypothetical protein
MKKTNQSTVFVSIFYHAHLGLQPSLWLTGAKRSIELLIERGALYFTDFFPCAQRKLRLHLTYWTVGITNQQVVLYK